MAPVVFLFFLGAAGPSPAQDKSLRYFQAANGFYAQKNYGQALRYYDAALRVNPGLWQAYQGMGNAYYAGGDQPKALVNYQKCLSLHPANPPLSSFVRSLRAAMEKAQAPREKKIPEAEAEKILRTASGISEAHFELSPSAGVAESGDLGLGFGGGVGGFYMFDSEFGLGGMVRLYLFGSSSTTTSPYTTQSNAQGTESATTNENLSSLELVPALKYKFWGKGFRPYLVAGFGITMLRASVAITYNYQNGPSKFGTNLNTSGSSPGLFFPVLDGGGGLEFDLDHDTSLFVEARVDVVISQNSSGTYLPVEAGLSFKL